MNVLSNQVDYNDCTGFTDTSGNSDPFSFEADTIGTFYFACGVGAHCSAGGMKAKITVAKSCDAKKVKIPWSFGMEPQVLCVETGKRTNFKIIYCQAQVKP